MELGPPRAHGNRLRGVRRDRARLRASRWRRPARTSSCSRAAEDVLEREAARVGGVPVTGDVTSADDLERLVSTAVERFGGVDVVVLNSGGPPRDRARSTSPTSSSRTLHSLLVVAPIRLVRLCRPHLEASGHGRVIAITSSAVEGTGRQSRALRARLRPGLVGWLKVAARELGRAGVTVNCVAPGRIDTDRIREVYPDGPTEADLADDPAPAPRHAA